MAENRKKAAKSGSQSLARMHRARVLLRQTRRRRRAEAESEDDVNKRRSRGAQVCGKTIKSPFIRAKRGAGSAERPQTVSRADGIRNQYDFPIN